MMLDVQDEEQPSIDVSSLNSGIYFMNVVSQNGSSVIKKVVVQ